MQGLQLVFVLLNTELFKAIKNKEEFEEAIQSFPDEIKEIARKTRDLSYAVLPEVVEVVWIKQKNIGFGTGFKKKTEHFCWIMPTTNYVNLGV